MTETDLCRAALLLCLRNAETRRVEEAAPISAVVVDYDAALPVAGAVVPFLLQRGWTLVAPPAASVFPADESMKGRVKVGPTFGLLVTGAGETLYAGDRPPSTVPTGWREIGAAMGVALMYVAVGLDLQTPGWEQRLEGVARRGNLVAAYAALELEPTWWPASGGQAVQTWPGP
jgi:hypothetical protein